MTMGHSEHFEFTDHRSSGLYTAQTETELQAFALELGYTGPLKRIVKAFPPAPPASVLRERAERDLYGYAEGDVQW